MGVQRLFVLLMALVLMAGVVTAGDLVPPGTPAPTMKTLSDIEPRTAIRAANIPLTISAPGSYYFAENISVSTTNINAITINSAGVTIDLNGFALIGPGKTAGSSGIGIVAASGAANVTVKNGVIRNWRGDGINLTLANSSIVHMVESNNNGGDGIDTGLSFIVSNCVAAGNSGSGIVVREGSTIHDSITRENLISGFVLFDGMSTIINCSAIGNALEGIAGGTNDPADGCTVRSCTVSDNGRNGILLRGGNTVSHCTVVSNGGDGIQVGSGNLIEHNTVADSGLDGIDVQSGNTVRFNTCRTNGLQGNAAGIIIGGQDNRIEDNHLASTQFGIFTNATFNLIVRNFATDNGDNYSIVNGNQVGAEITGTGSITSNAWANFSL